VDRPLRRIGGASSPGGPISQIISSLLLFALAFWLFATARRVASESTRMRFRILIGSGVGIIGAVFMIFIVPRWLPETPGSPGTLVGVALLWIFAAVILLGAVPALIGALSARTDGEGSEG
jgi:hypothetical protein